MALESKIESIKIQGFRSLADVELKDLPDSAVLIGPNGSGKSNLLLFLEMLQQMLRYRRLNQFVSRHGGADDQLFGGSAQTPRLELEIGLKAEQRRSKYVCTLSYTQRDQFSVDRESINVVQPGDIGPMGRLIFNWDTESGVLPVDPDGDSKTEEANKYLHESLMEFRDFLGGWSFHQFHNTGYHSNIKKRWDIEDNNHLTSDAGNLAAILYRLEREDERRYRYICQQVRRVLPNFDRFDIEESYGKVMLRWKAVDSDKTIGAHLTSDGSLRSFALITLLNLPPEMLPSIILLDEPELGLHPTAISLIGAMIKRVSLQRQVIVATQSPLLVDEFTPDEIFVMELEDGQTKVSRQDEEYLKVWLEEYSTGELWQKNVLGGRP